MLLFPLPSRWRPAHAPSYFRIIHLRPLLGRAISVMPHATRNSVRSPSNSTTANSTQPQCGFYPGFGLVDAKPAKMLYVGRKPENLRHKGIQSAGKKVE